MSLCLQRAHLRLLQLGDPLDALEQVMSVLDLALYLGVLCENLTLKRLILLSLHLDCILELLDGLLGMRFLAFRLCKLLRQPELLLKLRIQLFDLRYVVLLLHLILESFLVQIRLQSGYVLLKPAHLVLRIEDLLSHFTLFLEGFLSLLESCL